MLETDCASNVLKKHFAAACALVIMQSMLSILQNGEESMVKIPKRLDPPRGARALYLSGSPKPFWYDKKFSPKIREVRWRFDAKRKRCRGFFGRGKTRQFLHRYVLHLANRYYPEVTFSNGEWWDCRLVNLRPYDRIDDGANRRPFRKRQRKGVIWHKRRKKWAAMIRVNGHLRHLGYYTDPDAAAKAYHKAWKLAHPNLHR